MCVCVSNFVIFISNVDACGPQWSAMRETKKVFEKNNNSMWKHFIWYEFEWSRIHGCVGGRNKVFATNFSCWSCFLVLFIVWFSIKMNRWISILCVALNNHRAVQNPEFGFFVAYFVYGWIPCLWTGQALHVLSLTHAYLLSQLWFVQLHQLLNNVIHFIRWLSSGFISSSYLFFSLF